MVKGLGFTVVGLRFQVNVGNLIKKPWAYNTKIVGFI